MLLVLACGPGVEAPDEGGEGRGGAPPSSWTQISEGKRYRVSIRPEGEIPLGRLHSWIVHLETAEGEPVVPMRLAVSGGMPQHGHGFETKPRATGALGNGDFRIEGMKFHMAGDWQIRIEFVGPAGADVAIFQLPVEH